MQRIWATCWGLLAVAGCATPEVRFESDEAASAALVTLDQMDAPGERLGDLPIKLKVAEVRGKAVRLDVAGKPSHYWLFADTSSEMLTVRDRFNQSVAQGPVRDVAGETTQALQSYSRLLLKAYDALTKKKHDVVRQLAESLARLNPKVAAPHILKGASLLQEGRKDEARAALELAKSLDPQDGDIDKLLKAVQ